MLGRCDRGCRMAMILGLLLALLPARASYSAEGGDRISDRQSPDGERTDCFQAPVEGVELADTMVNAAFAAQLYWVPLPWVATKLPERIRQLMRPWRSKLEDFVPIPSRFMCRMVTQSFSRESFQRYRVNCLIKTVCGQPVLLWGKCADGEWSAFELPARLMDRERTQSR